MKTEILRRKFTALNFSVGSKERADANLDKITSEYMPSLKYVLRISIPETDKYMACTYDYLFRTKKEAEHQIGIRVDSINKARL